MSARFAKLAVLLSATLVASMASTASAQIIRQAIGGVRIDSQGVIDQDFVKLDAQTRQQIETYLNGAHDDIQSSTKLRMVSLRGLEQAINDADRSGQLPAEVQYMAGLQRIEFVILSPENNDIILAGPAEGWKVNEQGAIVGVTTNRPVIHLEDFLVAMRSVDAFAKGQGVTVSIDPTVEGRKQLSAFFNQIRRGSGAFDPSMQADVEAAMGDQQISLTGIPKDSRFASVLVAADYKMKRIAMALEPSPIGQLPTFLDLAVKLKSRKMRSAPRFWMECDYQPLAKSEDGQVWQIRGQGVRTMTEETYVSRNGETKTRPNGVAKKWAGLMTEHFNELAAADVVFGELRNVMDLSVAAALMRQQHMLKSVSLDIPAILGLTQVATTPTWTVPKTVPTQCSFVKLTRSWLITASGGVSIDSWAAAEKSEVDASIGQVAAIAMIQTADRWWWNAEN